MSTRPGDFVEPEATDAARHADELFVHGLMQQMHQDSAAAREQRVQSVLAGLHSHDASPARLNFSFMSRYARVARIGIAAAAALLLLVSLSYIGISTEKSADATVQATIAAMRSSGDRRYEIRAKLETDKDLASDPMAIIDTRAPNLMLLRSKGPDGRGITVGRDAAGVWAIKRDGYVERDNPEIRWPRWAMLGDESLFADSVDQLLETMSQAYDIKQGASSTLAGRGETRFTHLTGTKRRLRQPGPKQIDLWIDDSSKVVERMEMHFERPPQNGPDGGPNARTGPEGIHRPMEDIGGAGLPDDMDHLNRPENNGDRLPPPGRGPGPGGRPMGPPNGPLGGPRGDEFGPHDGHSGGSFDGQGRPNGPPDGASDLRDGRNSRDGHLIGDGAGPRSPRNGPPMGPLGRPDPRRGPRGEKLLPLELLVIDRVSPPSFSEDYFNAETHIPTAADGNSSGK